MKADPTPTIERLRVRYGETDAMGHAYYASYLYWFEQARGEWCRARGFTYREMEETGYFLPVVEAHVRYKREVRYDDQIAIHTTVTEIRRATVRFDYVVVDESTGVECTEGYTVHVVMGRERKAVTVPPELWEIFSRAPQ